MSNWKTDTAFVKLIRRRGFNKKSIAKLMGYSVAHSLDKFIKDPKQLTQHHREKLCRKLKVSSEILTEIINKPNTNIEKILEND